MASFTLTVPNAVVPDLLQAFADMYGYQDTIADAQGSTIPNPVTKAAFAKEKIREYVRDVYKAGKLKALTTARTTIINDADTTTGPITVE